MAPREAQAPDRTYSSWNCSWRRDFRGTSPAPSWGKAKSWRVAVSDGRAFAAPAKSPQQDDPDGQCPRAALQFPSLRSTGAGTRGKLSCHSRRSQVAPGDSGSSSAPTSSHQPPAKPAAPKRFQSLRRHRQFTIP